MHFSWTPLNSFRQFSASQDHCMLSWVDNDVAWESCTYWPQADHSVYCPEDPLPDDCRQLFHLTLAVMTSSLRPDLSGTVHRDFLGQRWEFQESLFGAWWVWKWYYTHKSVWHAAVISQKIKGSRLWPSPFWDKVSHEWLVVHKLSFGVKIWHLKVKLRATSSKHALKAVTRENKSILKVYFVLQNSLTFWTHFLGKNLSVHWLYSQSQQRVS